MKILEIDLRNQTFKEITVNKDLIKSFLGGPGFAIDYLMREKIHEIEPNNENNPLILMTGVLTGTSFPCSGYYSVSSKSPLTNIYGGGLSGGFFGAELRKSLNGIIFKNKSNSPIYLVIEDDHYELKDASELWGLTTDKTTKELKSRLGKQFKVTCIGPSGEKQIKMSSIINDHGRAVGRSGMGAIMGSKKLKAIAVRSTQKINYYDEKKFKETSKTLFHTFKDSPMVDALHQVGSNAINHYESFADVPHKNWSLGKWKGVNQISGNIVAEKMMVKLLSCFMCPFSCSRKIEIKEGPYKINEMKGLLEEWSKEK